MSEGLVVTGALLLCVAVVGERLVTNVVWLRDKIGMGHKVFLGAVGLGLVVLGVLPLGSGSDSTAGPEPTSSPRVEHSVEQEGAGEGSESGPTPTPTPSEPAMPQAPEVVRRYDAGSASTSQGDNSSSAVYGGTAGDTTLWARPYGLTTEDGTLMTPYTGERQPQPSDCAAIPVRQWSADVLTKRLEPGSAFCLFTEEERYGFIVVRDREVNTGGDLTRLEFTFQIWNGPQD